jgi:hypothetical protein
MLKHPAVFARRQRTRLAQQIVGHADLADVVELGAEEHLLLTRRVETEFSRNRPSVIRHADGVISGIRVAGLESSDE